MRLIGLLVLIFLSSPVLAETPVRLCSTAKWGPVRCIHQETYVRDVCQLIGEFSDRHGVDPHFLARLIWQESRFDPNALSPAGAQGIAQFMPGTAKLRGLKDPFNPADAIEHSAQYLSEMTEKYGNPGLAAVGYNGGERRAEGLLAGRDSLPWETVDYVQIITGLSYRDWLQTPAPKPDLRLSKSAPFDEACLDLAKNKTMVTFQKPENRRKPWGIQLAFGSTQARAAEKFRQMTQSCRALVGKEQPDYIFLKSRGNGRRGYFMARLGRDSNQQAQRDCIRLQRSGCICRVYKN